MSLYGSTKELILTLFLIDYKIIEGLLEMDLMNYEIEKNAGGNKIDIQAICPANKLEVMVECQIKKSDTRHLQTILDLIDSNKEGIIIWIASSFHLRHLEEVRIHLSKNKRKYINFYAFEIDDTALQIIDLLNEYEKNDIIPSLYRLSDTGVSALNLVDCLEQIPQNHIGSAYTHEKEYDLEIISERNQYICQELKTLIPNEINLISYKKPSKNSRMISIGAGKDGLTFRLSSEANNGKAVVLIHFANHRIKEYQLLINQMTSMKKQVHPNIKVIVDRQIGVQFKPSKNLDDTIKVLAETLEKLMQFCMPQFDRVNRLGRQNININSII